MRQKPWELDIVKIRTARNRSKSWNVGSMSDNLANDWAKRAGVYAGVITGEWGQG